MLTAIIRYFVNPNKAPKYIIYPVNIYDTHWIVFIVINIHRTKYSNGGLCGYFMMDSLGDTHALSAVPANVGFFLFMHMYLNLHGCNRRMKAKEGKKILVDVYPTYTLPRLTFDTKVLLCVHLFNGRKNKRKPLKEWASDPHSWKKILATHQTQNMEGN